MKAELNDEERDQIYNLLKEYVNANWSKDRRLIRSRLHVFIQSAMQRAVEEERNEIAVRFQAGMPTGDVKAWDLIKYCKEFNDWLINRQWVENNPK